MKGDGKIAAHWGGQIGWRRHHSAIFCFFTGGREVGRRHLQPDPPNAANGDQPPNDANNDFADFAPIFHASSPSSPSLPAVDERSEIVAVSGTGAARGVPDASLPK
jgi:hypothetical protein